jgi:hypothetical protein
MTHWHESRIHGFIFNLRKNKYLFFLKLMPVAGISIGSSITGSGGRWGEGRGEMGEIYCSYLM